MPFNDVMSQVADEHASESSFLWLQRAFAVHAPNYSPKQFADLDERLAAHIDGLRVAGEEGWKIAHAACDSGGAEDFFATAVLAIESKHARFSSFLERTKDIPEVMPGLISAMGWVSPQFLSGRVTPLLEAQLPMKQVLGLAACSLHRRDPGGLERFFVSPSGKVRARAFRASGELGRREFLPQLLTAIDDSKQEPRFWAAWSAVLLGDRGRALVALDDFALKPGRRQLQAMTLSLQAKQTSAGHELLQQIANLPNGSRLRIIGTGCVGDPLYVPWLIKQMSSPALARIAGEAFVNITGADVNLDQLESLPPEGFEDGLTEDPDDENVELPEDIPLPWLAIDQVSRWWEKHLSHFASGTKVFLGKPLDASNCKSHLVSAFQRQRCTAARYLALIQPGTVLFPTSAPAWRQKRLLASL